MCSFWCYFVALLLAVNAVMPGVTVIPQLGGTEQPGGALITSHTHKNTHTHNLSLFKCRTMALTPAGFGAVGDLRALSLCTLPRFGYTNTH